MPAVASAGRTGRPRASCVACRRSKIKCRADTCPDDPGDSTHPARALLAENRALQTKLDSLAAEVARLTSQTLLSPPLDAPLDRTYSIDEGQSTTPFPAYDHPPSLPSLPDVATAMAPPAPGQLSLESTGSSRYRGPLAAAHVLAYDDDDRSVSHRDVDDADLGAPFFPLFPTGSRKCETLRQARALLPNDADVERLLGIYWTASSWRFEPVTREHVDLLLLDLAAGASSRRVKQGGRLALLFEMLAIACLFDPADIAHSARAKQYDQCATACLDAADYLTNISVDTLATLHLHCCFLLNDDRPRMEEIYALVGLALRQATMAGFHRDGTWWQLPERDGNARRRVWWEILTLERINSNRFGCPPFISATSFDTLRPGDQAADSFLFWRWEWDDILHSLMGRIEKFGEDPDSCWSADALVRSWWTRLPVHLRAPIIEPRFVAGDDVELQCQQIRLALHYETGLLQVHRAAYGHALRLYPSVPLDSSSSNSVRVVLREVCPALLRLVDVLYHSDPTHTRHTVVALDLFTALVPLAALVIRAPRSDLAGDSHHQLLRGVQLLDFALDHTPCDWYRLLAKRGHVLAARATLRLATRWDAAADGGAGDLDPHAGADVDGMLGNVTRLVAQRPSVAATPLFDASGWTMPTLDDMDFERWLEALAEPATARA